MKIYYKALVALAAFLCLCNISSAQTLTNKGFKSGEEMNLILHYKFGVNADIAAVKSTITDSNKNGKACNYVKVTAQTYPFFDGFFKVRDTYESCFTNDFKTVYSRKDVSEGKYKAVVSHEWKNNGVALTMRKSTRPPVDSLMNLGSDVTDLLTVIYYIRSLDVNYLKKHDVLRTIISDRNLYDIRLCYRGTENKKVKGLGTYRCNKVGVSIIKHEGNKDMGDGGAYSVDGNLFKGNDDVIVWISDDDCQAPMVFTFPIRVGSVNGRLLSIEGSASELTSKISD